MPSIAIFVSSVAISGGTNVIFEHAMRLPEYGFDVTLVTREVVQQADLSWHRIKSRFRTGKIRWQTITEASQQQFDYAMATYWRTFFDLWRLNATKYLYFVQSIESRFYPTHERVLRSVVDGTYDCEIGVVTEACWIVDYLHKVHGIEASLAVNGIDKEIYRLDGAVAAPRDSHKFRVLVEGSIDAEFKNVPKTIELCRMAGVDETWLLTPSKVDAAAGVDRIFSQIAMADTAAVYRSCDIIVKLSLVEGVFGPPLEMFHCGGTALVYDVTGHDEYIIKGKNALVIGTGRENDVISALRILMEERDLLDRLKSNAVATAAAYPSWDQSSARFADAIKSAAQHANLSRDQLRTYCRRLWHSYEGSLREKERVPFEQQHRSSQDDNRSLRDRISLVRPLFDEDWYLRRNPDIREANVDPIEHYLEFGAAEGRDPSPLFDTRWYLSQNPDVRASGANPLVHFVEFGAQEGRAPSRFFDTAWYLRSNPDVERSGVNPLAHYLQFGAWEGRDPSSEFDSDFYLETNRDVLDAGINPLVHYIEHGNAEGRLPSALSQNGP